MQYINYEEAIIECYRIELQGWTYDRFVNPSELSTSLPSLRKLLNAIDTGDCKFVKQTAKEHCKGQETYKKKVANGEIKGCERKIRSDAGKRKRKAQDGLNEGSDDEESDSDEDLLPRKKNCHKSKAIIGDTDSE